MSAWFRVITRGAGREAQPVFCTPEEVEQVYPLDAYYPARALDREPREADQFLARRLVENPTRRAAIDEEAALNRMSRAELVAHVLALAKGQG